MWSPLKGHSTYPHVDVLGVSGRQMLHALADGEEDVERLVALARGSLKGKAAELRRALTSRLVC